MADDRMKKDDLHKNMKTGDKDRNYGQQAPGRSGQHDQQAGQHGNQPKSGQFGGQKGVRNVDDDDFDTGRSEKSGSQHRSGQNR